MRVELYGCTWEGEYDRVIVLCVSFVLALTHLGVTSLSVSHTSVGLHNVKCVSWKTSVCCPCLPGHERF